MDRQYWSAAGDGTVSISVIPAARTWRRIGRTNTVEMALVCPSCGCRLRGHAIEAESGAGADFGDEQLAETVVLHRDQPAAVLLDTIFRRVREFTVTNRRRVAACLMTSGQSHSDRMEKW